jgi:hypothetical protein
MIRSVVLDKEVAPHTNESLVILAIIHNMLKSTLIRISTRFNHQVEIAIRRLNIRRNTCHVPHLLGKIRLALLLLNEYSHMEDKRVKTHALSC